MTVLGLMSYQMGFQHVALGSPDSASHIACLHGDQQSLFVVWGDEHKLAM